MGFQCASCPDPRSRRHFNRPVSYVVKGKRKKQTFIGIATTGVTNTLIKLSGCQCVGELAPEGPSDKVIIKSQ